MTAMMMRERIDMDDKSNTNQTQPEPTPGHYSASECLAGWRSYVRTAGRDRTKCPDPDPKNIEGVPTSDGYERVIEDAVDIVYAQWWHVERWMSRFRITCSTAGWTLMFADWYKECPLRKPYSVAASVDDVYEELRTLPLRQAVEEYNKRARPSEQVTQRAAETAAKQGRLNAWKPRGEPMRTTRDEIRRWQECPEARGRKSA